MDSKIAEITSFYNEKLHEIDPQKLKLYMAYMNYLITLNALKKNGSDRIDEFKQGCYKKVVRDFPEVQSGAANFDEIERNVIVSLKNVLLLIQGYKNAIKDYYQDNGINVFSVRGHKYDVVRRSRNALNQYENESGNWVFATSTPKELNYYRLRVAEKGMTARDGIGTIYFGTSAHVQNGRMLLINPAYYYTFKSDKFMPVVRIMDSRDNPQNFHFDFSDEWTSDQDITEEDIVSVEEYTDVTDLVDSFNIFSVDEHNKETFETLARERNTDRLKAALKEGIRSGTVVYYNQLLYRNVDRFYIEDKALPDGSTQDSH